MKIEHKVIAVSVMFGLLAWIVDAVLDYLVFYEGTLLGLLITDVPRHELYIRSVGIASFLIFGIVVSRVMVDRKRAEQAREETELRATLYSIGDAVIAADIQGRLTRMNPVAEQLTGWTEAEAAGKPLDEVFHIVNEVTRRRVENPVKRVLREGVVAGLANHTLLISKNGKEIPIADAGAPIFDPQGNITGVVLVFRDQTEERLTRRFFETRLSLIEYAASHTLDELLTRALDEVGAFVDSPIGFYHFVEPDQHTLSLQQWSTRTLKESCQAEGKGMHYDIDQAGVWVDCVNEKKPVIHNDYASLPHKKGMPEGHAEVIRELVVPVMRADQVVAILGVGNKPTEYTQKDVEIVVYLADVTWEIVRRKRTEEALRESEENYRQLFEAESDALFLIDNQTGNILQANQAASDLYGYSRRELLAMKNTDLSAEPEQTQRVTQETLLAPERVVTIPLRWHRKKDGSRFPVEITGRFFVRAGRPAHIAAIRDITQRVRAEEALQRSEQFLKNIFDAIQDGISVLDTDLNVLRTNRWMEHRYAHQMPLSGRKCYQVYQQRQLPCPWCPTLRTIETGETHVEIVPYPSADNPTGWIELSAFPIKNEQGHVTEVIEYVKDVTEQVRAERATRERQRYLEGVLLAAPDAIVTLDPQNRIVDWNSGAERLFGYQRQEVIGQDIDPLIARGSILEEALAFTRLVSGGGMLSPTETVRYCRDGSPVNVIVAAGPIVVDGQLIGLVAVYTDISERVRAETERARLAAQVHEQARQMEHILATVPTGVLLLDADGRILQANPAAEQDLAALAGVKVGDILTQLGERPLAELLASPPGEGLWHEARADNRIFEVIARPLEPALSLPDEHDPEASGWVLVMRDVTQEREMQRYLQQGERLASIGKLAGGIAHDFNNLLVPMIGYTELGMLQLPADSRLYQDLERIKGAAERAADLVRQILAFSRQQVLEMRVLNLNEVVQEFGHILERLIGEDIALHIHLEPDLHPIRADERQLEQVLLNLAINARDAMPSGGELSIETANVLLDEAYVARHPDTEAGLHVMLAMSDTGQGMDAETQGHIFEPFFTTKSWGQGTGLGLATVFGIVKQHGGNIWVYSEPGRGTTFKIYLPISDAPVAGAEGEKKSESGSLRGGETVLVVEDEVSVHQLTCETLQAYGYRVLEAGSPAEALELAEAYPGTIHLLLTDIIMPGMNGRELYEQLAQARAGLKVLYMSGYTDNVIVHRGVLIDGVTFLQKPFTIYRLLQKVRQSLGEASDPAVMHPGEQAALGDPGEGGGS